jgi:putative transcriptional regulator
MAMNHVREFRGAQKLSQLALANEIGVARQTINLIENGKYNPSLDLCLKLAWALGTDLNSLFWRNQNEDENE